MTGNVDGIAVNFLRWTNEKVISMIPSNIAKLKTAGS